MDIRGVVFDVDDTLYDMAQPFFGAYQSFYGTQYDLPLQKLFLSFRHYSDERFADSQTGRMTMEELYIYRVRMMLRDYGIGVTDEEALAFQQRYMELQYQIRLSDTMKGLLDELRAHVTIGIITNGDSRHQRNKLRSLHVAPWIPEDQIIVSGDHPFRKPDVRIFREMEHRLNLLPENLIYVGDAFDLDIVGAEAAGWQAVWFNHRHRQVPATAQVQPCAEVVSEEELRALLMARIGK